MFGFLVPNGFEPLKHVLHAARRVCSFGIVDCHRQGLLAQPSANRVNIAARFDKNGADCMPQPVEREPCSDVAILPPSAWRRLW